MKNVLKEKMLAGERTLGTFFALAGAQSVICAPVSGAKLSDVENEPVFLVI